MRAGKLSKILCYLILIPKNLNEQLQTRNIAGIYVSISIIWHPFIEISILWSNRQHSMLAFHKKHKDLWKINAKVIFNIHVRVFGKSLQFWHLVYTWIIYLTLYDNFSIIIINNSMIKFSVIYVSNTGFLLQQLNIGWCREIS